MKSDQLGFRDVAARVIFAPLLGLAIPHATNLFGPLGPRDGWYWLGWLYFTLVSAVIWEGNRFFWIKLRRLANWTDQPFRRVLLVLATCVLYTTPAFLLLMLGWYRLAGFAQPDWQAIRSATVLVLVTTGFIVHTYETVFLIRHQAKLRIAFEEAERNKAQAELAALKGQLDPHFVFNCLNTLAELTEVAADRVADFALEFAGVYRYVLEHRQHELVPLAEELRFLEQYHSLLRVRFDDAVQVEAPRGVPGDIAVPPLSLQILLENAVKHTEFSPKNPLTVAIRWSAGALVVSNPLRRPARPAAGTGLGLRNLDDRCRLLLGRPLTVEQREDEYRVVLPVLEDARMELEDPAAYATPRAF